VGKKTPQTERRKSSFKETENSGRERGQTNIQLREKGNCTRKMEKVFEKKMLLPDDVRGRKKGADARRVLGVRSAYNEIGAEANVRGPTEGKTTLSGGEQR